MNRRNALQLLALALSLPATGLALAQAYPSMPIHLISPYGPGGGNDTIARLLGAKLGDALGQRVIVENKPGANTLIGNDTLAKSAPDGYTLILNGNAFATNPSFYSKMPFDTVKDIAPVAFVAFTDLVLVANAEVPASNVQELIALARSQPGKLNFGNTGHGGPEHLAGVMFGQLAGVDIGSVPYKGAAAAITDLIGGQVQLMITALAAVQPYIKNGRLKLIAIANDKRSARYPDVPTIAESGLKDFRTSLWYGMMAPAGTPQPIINRLNAEINKILLQDDVRKVFEERGLSPGDPAKYGTPERFAAFIKSELAGTAAITRAAGIKPE